MDPITVVLTGVKGGNRTKDPADSNQYEISALVPVSEIARCVSSGPFANLREGCSTDPTANKKSSSIVKAIKNQLVDGPEAFVRKNNGITLIADEASVDAHGKPGTLTITYSNGTFLREYKVDRSNTQQIRGLGNGGTTAGAIAEAVQEGLYPNSNGAAYVRVTVRCGSFSREEVRDMVEGLNKNRQVDSFSSANYGGAFKTIKEYLESDAAWVEGYAFPPVAYYYGAAGSYEIQDLIQFLTIFARTNEDGDPVPAMAYAGVENCLKYFQTVEGNKECLKYTSLLPHIVYLYEFIISSVQNAYNKKGTFYGLSLFDGMESPELELPFSHLTTTTRINNGWVFPLLAAFIPNVSDNKKNWRVDPKELFLRLAPKMITTLNEQFKEMGGTKGGRISALGRTPSVYTTLRSMIEVDVVRRERR